jgi:hypothetical protein
MGEINVPISIDSTMADSGFAATRCQARPSAARLGYREDLLCATHTSTSVVFDGSCVAVCRIHLGMYLRWGAAAEDLAAVRWGWAREAPEAPLAEAS